MTEFLFASHFSGCGGAAWGAKESNFKIVSGIEWDAKRPRIAELYRKNIGDCVYQDIATVEPHTLPIPLESDRMRDNQILLMQTSPPCQDYSIANQNRDTTSIRANILTSTYRHYQYFKPEYVVLENVRLFGKSQVYADFKSFLLNLDYRISEYSLNAADFGVAQTRKRLFMIAAQKGYRIPLILPTTPNNWLGWHECIEDLIDTLPESKLTSKQIRTIESSKSNLSVLVSSACSVNDKRLYSTRVKDGESFTIDTKNIPRALLVERVGDRNKSPKIVDEDTPLWTIRATLGGDGKECNRTQLIDAILSNGRVVTLNTRALARLQGFNDNYQFLGITRYDVRGIGKSVCPPVMSAICDAIKSVNKSNLKWE